jgi:hypothetical protein
MSSHDPIKIARRQHDIPVSAIAAEVPRDLLHHLRPLALLVHVVGAVALPVLSEATREEWLLIPVAIQETGQQHDAIAEWACRLAQFFVLPWRFNLHLQDTIAVAVVVGELIRASPVTSMDDEPRVDALDHLVDDLGLCPFARTIDYQNYGVPSSPR